MRGRVDDVCVCSFRPLVVCVCVFVCVNARERETERNAPLARGERRPTHGGGGGESGAKGGVAAAQRTMAQLRRR